MIFNIWPNQKTSEFGGRKKDNRIWSSTNNKKITKKDSAWIRNEWCSASSYLSFFKHQKQSNRGFNIWNYKKNLYTDIYTWNTKITPFPLPLTKAWIWSYCSFASDSFTKSILFCRMRMCFSFMISTAAKCSEVCGWGQDSFPAAEIQNIFYLNTNKWKISRSIKKNCE